MTGVHIVLSGPADNWRPGAEAAPLLAERELDLIGDEGAGDE